MRFLAHSIVLIAVFILTSLIPNSAMSDEPTLVDSCGAFSSQDGELLLVTQDLTSVGGDCITIVDSNVTLDCQGHRLRGPGLAGFEIAILADNVVNPTVQNCEMQDWFVGIYFYNFMELGSGGSILNSKSSNASGGFSLFRQDGVLIDGNKIEGNEGFAIQLWEADGAVITNNTAQTSGCPNGFGGIGLIRSNFNNLLGNATNRNCGYGIKIDDDSQYNYVADNTSNHNYYGIGLTHESINNMVEDNTANVNDFWGIVDTTTDTDNDYSGNRCKANGSGASDPADLCK